MGAESTKFTNGANQTLVDGSEAQYKPGGSPWTPNWLVFDNSYFKVTEKAQQGHPEDEELVSLSTDKILFVDPSFEPFAENFESYAKAHKKLSELGSKFDPAEGITI